MEATQSTSQALMSNPTATGQINPFLVFISGLGLGGLILKILENVLGKSIEAWWSKQKTVHEDKRYLADEIIKICTEGSINAWKKRPRSQEHIHYIANHVEGFNKKLADKIRSYLGIWMLHFLRQENLKIVNAKGMESQYHDEIQFLHKLQQDAKELEDEILVETYKLKR